MLNMQSFLQLNTIFISILIEAIPFVLLGVFISGFIQMFITEEMIAKIIPKNRFLAVLLTTIVGALFPACECGIVPIVRRLLLKGMETIYNYPGDFLDKTVEFNGFTYKDDALNKK